MATLSFADDGADGSFVGVGSGRVDADGGWILGGIVNVDSAEAMPSSLGLLDDKFVANRANERLPVPQ
jgi:hypothetical protein